MKKSKYILLVSIALSLFACKKSELPNLQKVPFKSSDSKIGELQVYTEFPLSENHPYKIMEFLKTEGSFSFHTSNPPEEKALSDNELVAMLHPEAFFNGGVRNNKGEFIKQTDVKFAGVDIIEIGGNTFNTYIKDATNIFKNFVSFSAKDDKEVEYKGDLYCPERIKLFNPKDIPISADKGNEIRWNKDELNTNGVVLITTVQTNNDPQVDGFVLVDDGSFTLPAEFLSKFPTGSKIDLELRRGNCTVIKKSDGTQVKIATSSSSIGKYTIK